MEYQYPVIFGGFIFCLIASFAALAFFNATSSSDGKKTSAAFPGFILSLIFCLAAAAAVFLLPGFADFISPLNQNGLWLSLGAAALFAASGLLPLPQGYRFALAAALIVPLVFLTGCRIIFFDHAPLWLNQTLTVILWLGATFSFRILNGICALPALEIINISLGIFILSFIGGTPVLTGALAFFLLAIALALLVYNWYPSSLALTASSLDSLGFISAFLMTAGSAESAGSCIFIFALYLIFELGLAFIKRLTFLPQFRDLTANTLYFQTNLSGLNPALIGSFIIKLNLAMLLFGIFQLYAPNIYSLPLFAAVFLTWNLYRMRHWETAATSLREINRQFVKDVKSGVDNIKTNLRKDD